MDVPRVLPGSHSVSRKWLGDMNFMLRSAYQRNKKAAAVSKTTTDPQKRKRPVPAKKDGSAKYNVLLLNGGQAYVPGTHWDLFLQKKTYDINAGTSVFMTEVETDPKTPRALAADLDYVMVERWPTTDEVLAHVQCMHQTVRRFLPEGKDECIVLLTVPRRITRNERIFFKLGVHPVWPDAIVTEDWCLQIRASWITDLELSFGRPANVDKLWESVVDHAIYRTGLRLPFSAKCERCKKCHNDEELRGVCDVCYGDGRIYDITNVYEPKFRITPDNKIVEAHFPDTFSALQRCALRRPEGVLRSDYRVPVGAPEPVKTGRACAAGDTREGEGEKKGKRTNVFHRADLFAEDRQGMSRHAKNGVFFEVDSVEVTEVIAFVRVSLDTRYEKVVPRHAWANARRNAIWITTKSSYCQNVARDHRNNTIYFWISAKEGQIFQRCWCTCLTLEGRLTGKKCEQYRSPGVRLPVSLLNLLFPNRLSKRKSGGPMPVAAVSRASSRTSAEIRATGGCDLTALADSISHMCMKAMGGRPLGRVMSAAVLGQ